MPKNNIVKSQLSLEFRELLTIKNTLGQRGNFYKDNSGYYENYLKRERLEAERPVTGNFNHF